MRTRQPDATEATEADVLELMEMILGALGRDAIGLGARWVLGRAVVGNLVHISGDC